MATEIRATITGAVWRINVKPGDRVEVGTVCVVLELMKMEIPVEAEESGIVYMILCREGQDVTEGDVLLTLY